MKILYFSNVNWKWIKQRPQFISENLGRLNHIVDYYSVMPLGKQILKKQNHKFLKIREFYVLPFSLKFKIISQINSLLMKMRLRSSVYDIIILTNPFQFDYLPQNKRSMILYECIDNQAYFYGEPLKTKFLEKEQQLLSQVDGIVVSSSELKRELEARLKRSIKIKVINNGLDFDLLKKVREVVLKKPNMVYLGTIDYWFDNEILDKFAVKYPNYTIYLIGPYTEKAIKRNNVIYLGRIEHQEIAGYIKAAEIMIMPFKVNKLIESVDPVKIYEYIAFNKYIVSSYWSEIKKFESNDVHFYKSLEDFERNILNYQEKPLTINKDFIKQNNWYNRAIQFVDFIWEVKNANNI